MCLSFLVPICVIRGFTLSLFCCNMSYFIPTLKCTRWMQVDMENHSGCRFFPEAEKQIKLALQTHPLWHCPLPTVLVFCVWVFLFFLQFLLQLCDLILLTSVLWREIRPQPTLVRGHSLGPWFCRWECPYCGFLEWARETCRFLY